MRTPYGLEIIESCMGCKASRESFFCRFSPAVLRSVDGASHHSIMPPGAVLFVEGQSPRGVYVLCSGKVKLSTTSKDGKVLMLKQAEAGEVLGLSAAISGTNYEMTAETATPSQLNFIRRQDLMSLMQEESEVGVHAALWLSRESQSAYRDVHDLVLARSSSGKLARRLLSWRLWPFSPSQTLLLDPKPGAVCPTSSALSLGRNGSLRRNVRAGCPSQSRPEVTYSLDRGGVRGELRREYGKHETGELTGQKARAVAWSARG